MTKKLTWRVIEDNGGGLHLVVFDGGDVIFYGYEYEFNHLALRENLQALQRGEDPREDGWEAPADVDAPRRWYNELHVGEPNGGVVIADNERIYYDRLGAEGTRFFVPRWDELELFDSDGNTLTTPENIQKALQEFRRDGGMLGVFFHFLGFPHEDPDDASTWGPPSPDAVDWEGFDAGNTR